MAASIHLKPETICCCAFVMFLWNAQGNDCLMISVLSLLR